MQNGIGKTFDICYRMDNSDLPYMLYDSCSVPEDVKFINDQWHIRLAIATIINMNLITILHECFAREGVFLFKIRGLLGSDYMKYC